MLGVANPKSAPDVAFIPFDENGSGAGVLITDDGGSKWTTGNFTSTAPHLILQSAAAHSAKSAAFTGVFDMAYTTDGYNVKDGVGPGLFNQGTGIAAFKEPLKFGAVGAFGKGPGVAVTTTGGVLWKGYSLNSTGLDATYEPRWGAFPSDTTWYVTMGSFPESDDDGQAPAKDDDFPATMGGKAEDWELTQRKSAGLSIWTHKATGERKLRLKHGPLGEHGQFEGAIVKTSDGGTTWTVQYQNAGTYYFNEIDCADETNCAAVAEGSDGGHIFTTNDGGTTWTQTNFLGQAQCSSVKAISATEYWAAGGVPGAQFQQGPHRPHHRHPQELVARRRQGRHPDGHGHGRRQPRLRHRHRGDAVLRHPQVLQDRADAAADAAAVPAAPGPDALRGPLRRPVLQRRDERHHHRPQRLHLLAAVHRHPQEQVPDRRARHGHGRAAVHPQRRGHRREELLPRVRPHRRQGRVPGPRLLQGAAGRPGRRPVHLRWR
jgi:hypothetical protein